MAVELVRKLEFDKEKCRHYVNGWNSVFHCHHYAALYTQLAEDAGELFNGHLLLKEAARDTFFHMLMEYFEKANIATTEDRISIVEQCCPATGMGKLVITDYSKEGGTAEMPFSHVDSGWIKKFGERKAPVNFIIAGYLEAAFATLYGTGIEQYEVVETQSIVSGAEKSVFTIKLKN